MFSFPEKGVRSHGIINCLKEKNSSRQGKDLKRGYEDLELKMNALFNLSVDIVWSLGAVFSNKKMENEMR